MQTASTTVEPSSAFTNSQEDEKHYIPYDPNCPCGRMMQEIGKRARAMRRELIIDIFDALSRAAESKTITDGGYSLIRVDLTRGGQIRFRFTFERSIYGVYVAAFSLEELLAAGAATSSELH